MDVILNIFPALTRKAVCSFRFRICILISQGYFRLAVYVLAKVWTEACFEFQSGNGLEGFLENFKIHVLGSESKIGQKLKGSPC